MDIDEIEEGRENDKLTLVGKAIQHLIPDDVRAIIILRDEKGMVQILKVEDEEQVQMMIASCAAHSEIMYHALRNIIKEVFEIGSGGTRGTGGAQC